MTENQRFFIFNLGWDDAYSFLDLEQKEGNFPRDNYLDENSDFDTEAIYNLFWRDGMTEEEEDKLADLANSREAKEEYIKGWNARVDKELGNLGNDEELSSFIIFSSRQI